MILLYNTYCQRPRPKKYCSEQASLVLKLMLKRNLQERPGINND